MKQQSKERRVGLARALSKLGVCSRSRASALIREGHVALNGRICRNPEAPVRLGQDRVTVDGKAIAASEKVYLALNKPRGVVTTASDEKGRDTVYSCLPDGLPWVAPVGRLDQASEGLLLLTNDSEWAARVAAPESSVPKTYHVQIAAQSSDELLKRLNTGIRGSDSEMLRCVRARFLRSGQKNSWLEIVLEEGKNRHIRRMMDSLRIEVLRLVRVAIGPLQLGDLPKGQTRPLTAAEKRLIDAELGDPF